MTQKIVRTCEIITLDGLLLLLATNMQTSPSAWSINAHAHTHTCIVSYG